MLLGFEIQDLAIMESMHLALENIVVTIFDGPNEYSKISPDLQHSLRQTLEGLITARSMYLIFFLGVPSADVVTVS